MIERNTTGRLYEETKHLDVKEIAKLIRKDISRECPPEKYSVRIERYAGGASIHIAVAANPSNPFGWYHGMRLSPDGESLKNQLYEIANRYNRDNSDMMSDYYDTRFIPEVRLERGGNHEG